jgi:hypothetical protein
MVIVALDPEKRTLPELVYEFEKTIKHDFLVHVTGVLKKAIPVQGENKVLIKSPIRNLYGLLTEGYDLLDTVKNNQQYAVRSVIIKALEEMGDYHVYKTFYEDIRSNANIPIYIWMFDIVAFLKCFGYNYSVFLEGDDNEQK